MKQKILILFAIGLLSNTVFAQQSQIVFQSDSNGKYSLWSVLDVQGASPVELTPLINAHAIQSGNNFGPINVSPDGKWYTFVSERFEADCSSLTGGNCLTVADFNFAHITSIRDGNGNVIHSTGVTSIFDGGNAIVYSDEGTHTLDVFIIRKISSSWTIPKMISGNSTYAYNINPRFSSDGKKVIFQGQSTAYTGESIMIVDSNGANLFEKINRNAKVDGSMGNPEVHMPSFAPDGSIIFEAQWGPGTPERVWHYSNLSTLLVMPDSTDLNDNSPVALPNGKVASLQLPNSTHDLKVENVDGSGKFFLTGLSTSFHQDVFDIGLGAGLANSFLTGIIPVKDASTNDIDIHCFPNPSTNQISIHTTSSTNNTVVTVSILNMLGDVMQEDKIKWSNDINIDIKNLSAGIYFLQVKMENRSVVKKFVKE